MHELTTSIEQALGSAPLVDKRALDERLPTLQDHPDDFRMAVELPETRQNDITYDGIDPPAWARVLEEAYRFVYGSSLHRRDQRYIQFTIDHELEHAQAAEMLGATSIRFYVSFYVANAVHGFRQIIPQAGVGAAYDDITKLAYIAATARPTVLSPGDINKIRAFGYKDVNDVYARLTAWNAQLRESETPYPLPLSITNRTPDTASGARRQGVGFHIAKTLEALFRRPSGYK